MYLLVIFFPLWSSIILLCFGSTLGINGSNLFSCICLGINVIISLIINYDIVINNSTITLNLWNWISFNIFDSNMTFFIDSLSGSMILIVNVVSFLVHVYSTSYMNGDPHTPSFMGYLSLFTTFMVVLVISQNYLQLFIGWEGVGLSSYLLINFWFNSIQANNAAIKAMLVNSLGDAALICAIVLIWVECGNINFLNVFSNHAYFANLMIPILLLIGAVGNSAQIGLHTWLPDAMEGPTPVSALIHAATMVTAGVYLIISSSCVFEIFPVSLILVTLVGSITALFAATIGLAQNDIKNIIAYSTCSQLGFMVLACGISYYSLGLFHLINHAFFNALLFLSAGSVIHALSDEQDISNMGGLSTYLPLSFVFILIGSLALLGTPFLSGYYSNDLLLELSTKQYFVIISSWLGIVATLLTALYSFNIIFSTFVFFNNFPKNYTSGLEEGEINLLWPLIILSLGSVFVGYIFKESVLGTLVHPNLSQLINFAPLIFSLLGILFASCLIIISNSCWSIFLSHYFNNTFSFLSTAWGFDNVITHFLVNNFWSFGYNISFKLFDSGFLELLGPLGLSSSIVLLTQKISIFQSGYLFNYTLLLLASVAIFLLLN